MTALLSLPKDETDTRRPVLTIPPNMPLRVVGDVHGDANAFAFASATDRFLIQLGDLTDYGPNSADVLRMMFRVIAEGRGLFLLGNHDLKLARVLAGHEVRLDSHLSATLTQLDPPLRERAGIEIARAPAWIRHGSRLFVHAGFHPMMIEMEAPPVALSSHVSGPVARALFGQPTGRMQPDGYPERSIRWVDLIPADLTVIVGHDRRSNDGRPYRRRGRAGGEAIFLDTGAGKGGHLSWIDLPAT